MKKFALAMCLVMAFGSAAYASNVSFIEGKVGGYTTWTNGAQSAENTGFYELRLTGSASGDGWSVNMKTTNNFGSAAAGLDDWSATAKDGNLELKAWGKGVDLGAKATPFEWIKSTAAPEDFKIRAIYAPVTVDYESADNSFWGFAEQKVSDLTLGGAVKRAAEANETLVDGYAKAKVSTVDLTGEVAIKSTSAISSDNSRLGGKAVFPIVSGINGTVQYTTMAKNFGDESKLYLKAEQSKTNTIFAGEYWTSKYANGNDKIKAGVQAIARYRASTEKSFDDAVSPDYYMALSGLTAQGWLKNEKDTTANGTTTLTLKAATPVIPGKAWVLAHLINISDNDGSKNVSFDLISGSVALGDATTKSNTEFNAWARWQATAKVQLNGELKMKAAGGDNAMKIGIKPSYQIASNMKLYGEFWKDSTSVKSVKSNNQVKLGVEATF